jgi:hypothetical protein
MTVRAVGLRNANDPARRLALAWPMTSSPRLAMNALPRALPLVACLLLLTPSALAQGGAPSEAEMREALMARFEAMNAGLEDTRERCRRREFQGDPMMAMQCLAVMAAAGGDRELTYDLTNFQKIACEKATGQPGYICDYYSGITSNSPFMQGSMARLLGGGSMSQGRFVRTERGWLLVPATNG